MKKALPALCFLALTLAASCKKDDNNGGNNNNNNNGGAAMTCKINGSSWSTNMPASYILIGGRHQLGFSRSENGKYENFIIDLDNITPNTYSLSGTTDNTVTFAVMATTDIYTSQSGSVKITKYDAGSKRIEGDFSAELQGTTNKSITDGHFAYTHQ